MRAAAASENRRPELRLEQGYAWYVQPALEARSVQGRPLRHALFGTPVASLAVLVLAACGTGPRQDVKEPRGRFPVDVLTTKFPTSQKLAKASELVIAVRNAGSKTIPNLAVTVSGFDKRMKDPRLADPNRPVFVLNGQREKVGNLPEATEGGPRGCLTSQGGTPDSPATKSTWACGPLRPGATRTFRWSVTAVQAGPFRVAWRLDAGLYGKAKAVGAGGQPISGDFTGRISNRPPQQRVSDNGRSIVNGTR